jgi:hypothetical protein
VGKGGNRAAVLANTSAGVGVIVTCNSVNAMLAPEI